MGMPSCRELYSLRSSGRLESAAPWTRLLAALHLAMCSHCARLVSQLAAVNAALRGHMKRPLGDTASLRRRILERLSRPD